LLLVSARLPRHDIVALLAQPNRVQAPVVITEAEENQVELVPLLELGASGYVPRSAELPEVIARLHAIHAGSSPIAPEIGTALVTRLKDLLQRPHREDPLVDVRNLAVMLTERECAILDLICMGMSNQEIASELMIELGTVKNHVHNILKKMNVGSRTQAAHYFSLLRQQQAVRDTQPTSNPPVA
jgi:DNA-binding NarL/FixJ family response regulator